MSFKTKQLIPYFFSPADNATNKHLCKKCGKDVVQELMAGYSNLMRHLKACLPTFVQEFQAHLLTNPGRLEVYGFSDSKAANIFAWLESVILTNQPFSYVEDPIIRRQSKYEGICVDTLMKYHDLVVKRVEEKVKLELPEKFGILFDGWSERSTHYLAVYAVFPPKENCVSKRLLSLAPMAEEISFTAQVHKDHLEYILNEFYGRDLSSVVFLSGDNCSTNVAFGKLLHVPLIGCASHRLNLAVQEVLSQFDSTLKRINSLMIELTNLKNAGRLRKLMKEENQRPLLPIKRNQTRWLSTFNMVKRYFKLKPFIQRIEETEAFWPIRDDEKLLTTNIELLKELESLTTYIQGDSITLYDTRRVFDKLLAKYPNVGPLKKYLSQDANVVCNKHFENGVVKILSGKEKSLSPAEMAVMSVFKKPTPRNQVQTDKSSTTIVDEYLSEKSKIGSSCYINLDFVPATSNAAERLFSMCKFALPSHCKATTPENLERRLFLRMNCDLWDLSLMREIAMGN